MSHRRLFGCVFFSILLAVLALSPFGSAGRRAPAAEPPQTVLIAGRNVNMVSGTQLPAGDPFLQRQNEPSIAVSTRNPMHILAGANDYRTVDLTVPNEEIPGYVAIRDAWLGLYFSFDGGQSWKSTLLPGYPLDSYYTSSPLKAYGTAADPVVRAGTNGLFYYAGLVFTRAQSDNAVFVARLVDNNNSESPNAYPIKYIDAKVLDKGTTGQFIDKPWLAVDIPRTGAKRVTLQSPGIPTQTISAGNVYLAYSIFTGQDLSNPFSRVTLIRSLDCGTTWEKPIKVSESHHLNQGVTMAIAPGSGNIYMAWRRFAHSTDGDAIMTSYSTDGGKTFCKAILVAAIAPFDQGTSATSFRTNSYPALTVDAGGTVYLAWAQRGVGPGSDARIVVSTSTNGEVWTAPQALDNHGGRGHQFMPSLAYGAGMITAAWYDARNDAAGFGTYINGINHTIDVRAAQFAVATGVGSAVQVSRYLGLLDGSGVVHQVQYNPPNLPLFKEGTRPFHGDYIDMTPVPMFLPTPGGGWTFNTDGNQSPVFHAAWTDNRNVKPPSDGNWTNYAPPSSSQDPAFQSGMTCAPGQTSMRNQDVYMASLTRGLVVGSPSNIKPLNRTSNKHTFVVYVKNMTAFQRRFRLTLDPAAGVTASFLQFASLTTLEVEVARASSISRTVFATGSTKFGSIRVNVVEIDSTSGTVNSGLTGFTILNPDIENPDIENPDIENKELHNPDIENPDIENPDIENVIMLNPDIENPDIENPDIINPDIENPDIENPDIENPDIENPAFFNPDIENPDIENPDIENGSISDYTWTVANAGNTTSAFAFKMISEGLNLANYSGFGFQLLIYRVHPVPAATTANPLSCVLTQKHQDELLANILSPIIFNQDWQNPDVENPDIVNPDTKNATFWLEPGDRAYITLRIYDPNKNDAVKLDPEVTPIMGVTTAQAVNSADEGSARPTPPLSAHVTALTIFYETLPYAKLGTPYATYLVAVGGTPHYTWSLASGSALPAGLSLNPETGAITGTPTVGGIFPIVFQVWDSASPSPATVAKSLTLNITGALDHFDFGPISTPVLTVPFPLTIAAKDVFGNLVESYTGTNTLSLTPALNSIIPAATTAFVAGVWSGTVTINGPFPSSVQIVTTGGGMSGTSSPFTLLPPPDTTPPAVTSFSPQPGSSSAAIDASLAITFTENVLKDSGNIVIKKTANDSVFESIDVNSGRVSVANNVATIDPAGTFAFATGYYVQIDSTCFKDASRNFYVGINDRTTWAFTIADAGNLVAYYPFNGNANDASGLGNNGTLSRGVTLTSDRFGTAASAYSFDGVKGYITVPNSVSLSVANFQGGYTMTAWIKSAVIAADGQVIISKNTNGFTMRLRAAGGKDLDNLEACQRQSNGTISCQTPGVHPPLGQWSFVAVTWDAASRVWQMYLNGVVAASSGSLSSLMTATDGTLTIGKDPSHGGWFFNGAIDDVRIYNRAFSALEILSLYQK